MSCKKLVVFSTKVPSYAFMRYRYVIFTERYVFSVREDDRGYGKSVRGLHVFVEKTIYLKISYIFCQSVDGLRVHALQACQLYRKIYFFYAGGR